MKVVSGRPRIGHLLRDALIKVFASSESFDSAKYNTERLLSFSGFSIVQVRKITQHTMDNDQIYRCFTAQRLLRDLALEYKNKLNPKVYKKLVDLIS